MSFKRILAALDRSPLGQVVLEQALAIAKQEGASLMLFHCFPIESQLVAPYASLYGEELTNFASVFREQLEKDTQDAQQWLTELGQTATTAGIATEWDVKVGEPGRWIRDIAKSWNADLIIIGRRGLHGIGELFLGSVSNYVVHHANCSVLVIQGRETKTISDNVDS